MSNRKCQLKLPIYCKLLNQKLFCVYLLFNCHTNTRQGKIYNLLFLFRKESSQKLSINGSHAMSISSDLQAAYLFRSTLMRENETKLAPPVSSA